nr:uncharacterized protein LOC100177248 [Ciona intestinalis]|eukprot:XP_018673024.1 uncharacterized protein LOC100177248 [Ciona intestinalis]
MKTTEISIRRNKNDLKMVDEIWGSGVYNWKKKDPTKILHRSDMLLEKQLKATLAALKELNAAIAKLENSKSSTEKQNIMGDLTTLNRMIAHLRIVLDVLNKINKEIEFYRNKMNQAILNHQDDAELYRQRVRWLEQRLEKIVNENSSENMKKMFQKPGVLPPLPEPIQEKSAEGHTRASTSPPKSILLSDAQRSFLSKKAVTLADFPGRVTNNQDVADRYWREGHHRMSYSENMGQLLEDNPLSYHKIGLAIPATYVDRNIFSADSGRSSSLPWMSEQDPMKGNFDILRDDLERIRKRVHRIQEKIYVAANLSTNFETCSPESAVAKPQSREGLQSTPQTPGTANSQLEGQRVYSRSLTAGSLARISSSATPVSSTETFESSSIQPIQIETRNIMPLTRMNMSKTYPHVCDRWSGARPNENSIASQPTIVDQRDLQNKTKMKLFVAKRRKQHNQVVRDLITPSSVSSNRSFRKVGNTVRFVEKLKSSEGSALSQIQKDRLNQLLTTVSSSSRHEERVYAARSLSTLGVTASEEITPTLVEVLSNETNTQVRFEVAKALINLGDWHTSAINELTFHLQSGGQEVSLDVLEHIACSCNTSPLQLSVNEIPELRELVEVLHILAGTPDPEDEISFQAAVCLAEICGLYDDTSASISLSKLLSVIKHTTKWNWHAQALEALVRQLNCCHEPTLKAMVTQLNHATKWQDRLSAALLIAYCGPAKVFPVMNEDSIFNILDRKLWDDAKRDVRLGVSQAFTALGMRNRLLEVLDSRLDDNNPEVRSQAVMSMSAAGIRSDRTLRSLVEMLGLDSSDYVRLQIMRTFQALGITDIRVVRALREREKGGGPLSRQASKILAALDVRLTTGISSQTRSRSQERVKKSTSDSRMTTSSSWPSSPWGVNRDSVTRGSKWGNPLSATRGSSKARGSAYSSNPSYAYSSPQYEVISTAVQKPRASSIQRSAVASRMTIASVSTIF